jgi:hypothetical protein
VIDEPLWFRFVYATALQILVLVAVVAALLGAWRVIAGIGAFCVAMELLRFWLGDLRVVSDNEERRTSLRMLLFLVLLLAGMVAALLSR